MIGKAGIVESMTEDQHKRYIRQRNAGALPWELDQSTPSGAEHPVFQQRTEENNGTGMGAQVQPLPENFSPDAVYVEFLREHYGIPDEYTFGQLTEFKLYWRETGEARKAWQSKFKNHVIYQWKRDQSEASKRTHQSTVDKLTDCSWAEGLQLGDDEEK
ncbi:hypothetical protein CI610_00616 [invertebrate metagenome]|uniref:DnaT DNA-binding domain-containing protein n=1 Tax=invertebrate metagenome TaxID=1711999 RepID=A0A2H9TB08_9ZZZZ